VVRIGPKTPGWTSPDDVIAALRRRWDRGDFLTMIALGSPWEPLAVPLRTPTAGQLADHFGAAQTWMGRWRGVDPAVIRLEYKPVGGRVIGSNTLPCRVWIDSHVQLCRLLDVTSQAERYLQLLDATSVRAPALVDWMSSNPTKVLAHQTSWLDLVDTAVWIGRHAHSGMYLRQVDVPGVDTKFIEGHRGILAELLDRHLPADRIDTTHPPSEFARRYRFRAKPLYVRVRTLHEMPSFLGPHTEATLRVDELAANPIPAGTVVLVENEVTYLAFPQLDDAILMLGGGYALPGLQPLHWLHDRRIVYWGDIDTHGFAILNRLRQVFPHATAMLMDRATLLNHRTQWVREPAPTTAQLPYLHPEEAALYQDLIEDRLGPSVRLEQERIRYSAIEEALRRHRSHLRGPAG
jgi:hypothetical protein